MRRIRQIFSNLIMPPKVTATVACVLDTTELLEAILAQLPPIDLLRLRRVCRRWKNVVQESTLLQRKLFLEMKLMNGTDTLSLHAAFRSLIISMYRLSSVTLTC